VRTLRGLLDVFAGLWPVRYDDHHHEPDAVLHRGRRLPHRHGLQHDDGPVRERVRRREPFNLPRWLLRRRHLPARHGSKRLRERPRLRGLRCNEPVRERLRDWTN